MMPTEETRERAVLVGVHLPLASDGNRGGPPDTDELARLLATAGGEAVAVVNQRLNRPSAANYVGKGKLEELKEVVEEHEANLVVFDNDLSPSQGRNLQKALGEEVRVLDRTELILDIFARHARTQQARLQVEFAQLEYLRPRLRRMWGHLERQAGHIGTRGPGESQLETDRRLIDRRLAHLRRELKDIRSARRTQTSGRTDLFRAAIVGYTNAGKSTLMNAVTGADVLIEDQLFATLDATTRRVDADERRSFLLTDTVGFIRRLPHHLVESFRATLQEVDDADLLVHVVDAGAENPEQQIEAVDRVLADLEALDKPTLMVFNKMDTVPEPELFANGFARHYAGALFVSARAPGGGAPVRDAVVARLCQQERIFHLRVPAGRIGLIGPYHRTGDVLGQQWEDGACLVDVRMREDDCRRLLAREPGVREVPGT
jgi:GTP-binding protein HflX